MAGIATKHTLPAPFHEYELDDAFDEMVDSAGAVRPHYRNIYEALRELTADNQGKVVLENLTPGQYELTRTKTFRGSDMGRTVLYDRRTVTVAAGIRRVKQSARNSLT